MKTLAPLQSKGIMANVRLAMKTIPLTQGQVAIVDDEDFERLNQWKWHAQRRTGGSWYARRSIWHPEIRWQENIGMHNVILNCKPVDYIDGNGLNNTRLNIRKCTNAQNHANMRKSHGLSKHKGVSWNKNSKKWVAHIGYNYKIEHLGSFRKEDDAARAYDLAATKLFGEFAYLNFPF